MVSPNKRCSRVCSREAGVPTVSPQGARSFPHFPQAMCRTKKTMLVAIQAFQKVVVAEGTSFSMMA
jgi:hypothetical protein